MRILFIAALASLGRLPAAQGEDKTAAQKPLDPALARMAEMIGGVWSNDNPKFRVEFRYDWAFNQTAVRGIGVVDKGGPTRRLLRPHLAGTRTIKRSTIWIITAVSGFTKERCAWMATAWSSSSRP